MPRRSTRAPSLPAYAIVSCLLAGIGHDAVADPTYLDKVGHTALSASLGASMPDGTGVGVAQVELKVSTYYLPQGGVGTYSGAGNFLGKTFVAQSPGGGGTSAHAAAVANYFYGIETNPAAGIASMAPGVTDIDCFANLHYLNGAMSAAFDKKVHSHAWIDATPSVGLIDSLDVAIDSNGFLAVTGLRNGSGSVPALIASAYNVISVGRSDGNHGSGFTPGTIPGEGRIKPEVVAPYDATSWAVGGVSSLSAVLYEAAMGSPALSNAYDHSEAMKSVVMAGATKEEFPGWGRTATVPLDVTYGAGEVNLEESYGILTAGEQEAGGVIGTRGWDLGSLPIPIEIAPGFILDYEYAVVYPFTVPAGMTANEVSVILTWNRIGAEGTVRNLTLQLLNGTEGFEWDASRSEVDNVEHVHYRNLPEGDYALRVSRLEGGTETTSYGLAWRMELGAGPEIAVTQAGPDNLLDLTNLDPLVEYTIERSTNGMSWSVLETFTPAGTSYGTTDSGGGGVSYRLNWTPRSNGATPPSDAGSVDPDSGGGGPGEEITIDPCLTPGFNCPRINVVPSEGTLVEIAQLIPGEPCVIEMSVDLNQWADVHAFTPSGTEYSWRQPGPGSAQQYFRLRGEVQPGASETEVVVTPPPGTLVQFGDLEADVDYVVEKSEDMFTWQRVHTFTATGATYDWFNKNAFGQSLFYRLRWVTPPE